MNSKPLFITNLWLYSLLLLSGLAYYFLGYETPREKFMQLCILFTILFVCYAIIYTKFSVSYFQIIVVAGMLFRVLLLFSVPNLSDDVYRFIWDGRLLANGISPFRYLPAEVLDLRPIPGVSKELFGLLNSPGYFTIYPPVLQFIFWLAAIIYPLKINAAIVFLKVVIILVELLNFTLLSLILKRLVLPKHYSLLYILNPLVIIELTGNIHFEGVMIAFVLTSFLLLLQHRWQLSAIMLGLGIGTKLLPVLFVPLVVNRLGWKKGLLFTLISGVCTLVLFSFFLNAEIIHHLLNSINLFFQKFEFNASIYYLVRWLGAVVTGYNLIALAGPALTIIAAIIILWLSFSKKHYKDEQFVTTALFIISSWFLFSTTVHPWYICLPAAFAVFTPFRYAILWCFTATLSYAAYQYSPVQENLWLVGAGYVFVIAFAVWELKQKQKS